MFTERVIGKYPYGTAGSILIITVLASPSRAGHARRGGFSDAHLAVVAEEVGVA